MKFSEFKDLSEGIMTVSQLKDLGMTQEEQQELINSNKEKIRNLHKVSNEHKDMIMDLVGWYTHAKNGVVTDLDLHPLLRKKIQEKDLPSSFSMGVDKDGFFVHTHRARCKSFPSPEKIGVKEIRFISSTS